MARRGEPAEFEAAEVDLFAVGDASDRETVTGCARYEQRGAECAELTGAGDEVGVEVGLDREGDVETSAFGLRQVPARMAGRVDHERPARAQIDEIGRVAETIVDERDQLGVAGPLRRHPKPPRGATVFGRSCSL